MNVLQRMIEKNGVAHQCFVVMEELGELAQAISKCQRFGVNEERRNHLIEELADVYMVLNELEIMYDIKAIEIMDVMQKKMKKMEDSLNVGENAM